LKANGTFAQRITIDGKPFAAAGEWIIEKPRTVKLQGFLVRFDTSSGRVIDPPLKYGAYIGFWNSKRERIEFDEEDRYCLEREPKR